MALEQSKQQVNFFFDKAVHRIIKSYACETGQTIPEVLKEPLEQFEQSAIKIACNIEKMKKDALLKQIKEEEEAKLVSQNPIVVSGHEEEPIGSLEVAPEAQ